MILPKILSLCACLVAAFASHAQSNPDAASPYDDNIAIAYPSADVQAKPALKRNAVMPGEVMSNPLLLASSVLVMD